MTLRSAALAVVATCVLSPEARAHTGSGIAVDQLGRVYFLDTGSGLWRIDPDGALTRLSPTRFHWLALDASNALANARLPSGSDGDVERVGTDPTILLASDWPIAVGRDGNLYRPSGPAGSLQLERIAPSGVTSVFVTFPETRTGTLLPHLNGITSGADGSLYYTENAAIRRITAQGAVSVVATVTALANGPSIPGTDEHPLLRGLALDSAGVLYVADNGDARVLRITPDGKTTTLLQTESPWSPTAVAVSGGDVYVLEFLHTARDVREDWLPRVRKVAADGTHTILATVDRMPGARASLPPPPHEVTELTAEVEGSGACRLDWKAPAPADDATGLQLGAVSHYRIERRARDSTGQPVEDWGVWQATSTDTQATVSGLVRGMRYEFRVLTVNAGGSALPSDVVSVAVE